MKQQNPVPVDALKITNDDERISFSLIVITINCMEFSFQQIEWIDCVTSMPFALESKIESTIFHIN